MTTPRKLATTAHGRAPGRSGRVSAKPERPLPSSRASQTYFRRGFGLKTQIRPLVDAEYQSAVVERIRSAGYETRFGNMGVRLAKEFGFCYGVDRAVDYAYQTRHKFPDKRIYLVGEIIHNPHVNQRLREMGIEFIYPKPGSGFDFGHITPDDVVIIPAFGVTVKDMEVLRSVGCVLVDTTCGSVLLVWKRVEGYARDGFTAVIHGKHQHEESQATASQVDRHEGGKYLVLRNMTEAEVVGAYMTGAPGRLGREEFLRFFRDRTSPDFDPDRDLRKIGVANQTTMLASESMAIGARLREMMVEAKGEDHASEHFRSFGTICSATQERQDAIKEMMRDPPDVMIVLGGYNSSNTNHLAHLCRQYASTFHIEDATCIDVETGVVRHKPVLDADAAEVRERDWLPRGPFELGITAGASTPNNKIGEALLRILEILGIDAEAQEA